MKVMQPLNIATATVAYISSENTASGSFKFWKNILMEQQSDLSVYILVFE